MIFPENRFPLFRIIALKFVLRFPAQRSMNCCAADPGSSQNSEFPKVPDLRYIAIRVKDAREHVYGAAPRPGNRLLYFTCFARNAIERCQASLAAASLKLPRSSQ